MSCRISNRKRRLPKGKELEVESQETQSGSQSQSLLDAPIQKKTKGKKLKPKPIASAPVDLDVIDELVSEASVEGTDHDVEEEVKPKAPKNFTTGGKRISKFDRSKRQVDYKHKTDVDEYKDFKIQAPKSGDELFDNEGKYNFFS